MPPKRNGRSRSSSRSRPQSADQPEIEQEEEKKDPIHQEEDQEEEEEPPQDVPLQAAQVAAGAMPQVAFAPPPPAVVFAPLQAGLPPEQEQAPGASSISRDGCSTKSTIYLPCTNGENFHPNQKYC